MQGAEAPGVNTPHVACLVKSIKIQKDPEIRIFSDWLSLRTCPYGRPGRVPRENHYPAWRVPVVFRLWVPVVPLRDS